ncbi:histone deacetylase family protein [Legionella israelensis]|uniref:Histone deacetylase-like amidohydrolase n=1 Tax=Legionella israelensis TaxID=454 RepID=A0A0W0V474_9GAMM|nr:histone deacetylase family protein [Legionella israelensis]KTD14944.1 Histone deacetylase-like amidohydrolase [Legionella israelensis]QBS09591.1 histone deacetylase family protein [Legionella israelensis]SCY23806.1 Acetoin utilization deacetylase AcuC [Legionella israelensis DSM 19235]STX60515.1 Histone deacetylase-like amidohydrolase [Legionella israelensis]
MTIAFISHPDCLLHNMGNYHPESPERLKVIDEAIDKNPLAAQIKRYQAPLATKEQLLCVHDERYVNFVFQSSPKEGSVVLDPDVVMNPSSLQAALRAAGAAVYAVELVMNEEAESAFCNVRPPGHHAERNKAMGFCLFNNVAVAVAHALNAFKLKKVAIIDFDVHHGNGTEHIFKNNEQVLYCSTFEHPFYPFCGTETHSKHIINIPLPAGTTGSLFREKIEELWLNQVREFQPDMIFFSAGFDAYEEDNMADLLLKDEDYFWVTQKIKEIADECCQGRMVSALEGGYHLPGLGLCAVAHLRGLLSSPAD